MTEEYNHERFWEYGKWSNRLAGGVEQFSHLFLDGLKPHHYFLDIGCGWLRGGINFIEYLDIGHYYGFDKEERQLERGEVLLKGKDLVNKKPIIRLIHNSNRIGRFIKGMEFDYMMAYSVFTHVDPYMTERIFNGVIPSLRDTGRFFATFLKSESDNIVPGGPHMNRKNEYNFIRYPFSFFEDLAHKNGVFVEHSLLLKDFSGQDWMYFYRKEILDGSTS